MLSLSTHSSSRKPDPTYQPFTEYLASIRSITTEPFKTHSHFSYMLEHVSPLIGVGYLDALKNEFPSLAADLPLLQRFADHNDGLGKPERHHIGEIFASPTSIRYLYFAALIHAELKKKNLNKIVEIGAGYGGLCLAVHHLAAHFGTDITSYHICDLPSAIKFQERYIELRSPHILEHMEFHPAEELGSRIEESELFLVSTYSFSEIDAEYQSGYIRHLFPHIKGGFIAWNGIPLYDLSKKVRIEEERPKTSFPNNKFVFIEE